MPLHFALGPMNLAAGPAHLPRKPARAAFPRKSSPAGHSLRVSKNVTHSPQMVRTERRQVTLIWGGFLALTALMGQHSNFWLLPTLLSPLHPTSPLGPHAPWSLLPKHTIAQGIKIPGGHGHFRFISNSPDPGSFCTHSRNLMGADGYTAVCIS